MQNQNIEKILCFSEIFNPNSPRKCLRMDRKGTERTEMGQKSGPKFGFFRKLENARDQGVENYYAHRIVTCQNIERLKCKF